MKIIYEDGADRPQNDLPSDTAPAPQNEAATPQALLDNLTPEQINTLMQLLAERQKQAEAAQAQPEPEQSPQHDPGTRILYQSTEFEQPEQKTRKPARPTPDPGMRIAYQAKDSEELMEQRNRQREAMQGSFSVNEFSLEEEEPFDQPPAAGDIAVREVDEATEAFQTQHARLLTSLPVSPETEPEPQAQAEPEPAPQPPAEAPANAPQQEVAAPQPTPEPAPTPRPTVQQPPATASFARISAEDAQTAERKREPKKEKKKRKPWSPARKAVLIVSVIAILASAGVLAWEYKLHKDNLKLENEISDLILETQVAPPAAGGNTIILTEEQQWEQLRGEFPGVIFPQGMQLKYARLYVTNQDFVGYLEIPGVNMSLPVVQTSNDADYLARNFYGKSTKYGCPFVSCINNIADLDYNTVIFGHHMNDRTIFGALDAYKRIDGFRSAPLISFNTLYADYNWKIVAVILTNSVAADDNGYVFNYYFNQLSSDEKKAGYLQALKERSLYDTGVDVLPTDKLLTLSTCSYEFENARLVVVARLVRPGESTEVDTAAATLNSSPRYPQVYYSKKKKTNPYADAPRWEVG